MDPRHTDDGMALEQLKKHGHAFSAAVNMAGDRAAARHGEWRLDAAEFAGQLHGRDYHADGIFEFVANTEGLPRLYVVQESKRGHDSQPWFFFRDSVMRRSMTQRMPLVDLFTPSNAGFPFQAMAKRLRTQAALYSRTASDHKDEPDRAIAQACRGAAIVINSAPQFVLKRGTVVIPLVVTLAPLIVIDQEIAGAVRADGELDRRKLTTARPPWVWFETHLTPSLRSNGVRVSNCQPQQRTDQFGYILDDDQARAVMITTFTGLNDALEEIANACVSLLEPEP